MKIYQKQFISFGLDLTMIKTQEARTSVR